MLNYQKTANGIVLTREDNKTIIFQDDGTIIGISGKPLKGRPRNFIECLFSIALGGRLEDTIKLFNHHYASYELNVSNEEDAGQIERLFKVLVRNAYSKKCTQWANSEDIVECFCTARTYYHLLKNHDLTGGTETNVIKFFNDTKTYRRYGYRDAKESFIQWNLTNTFWTDLPPVEYPEIVKEIVTRIISGRSALSDGEVKALKQAVVNQLIVNLDLVYDELGLNSWNKNSHIQHFIIGYFDLCKALNEEPNLNGNFITKLANAKRQFEAQKEQLFEKNQLRRNLCFEYGNLMVVVPTTVAELVTEGENQHNCVGHYGYDKEVIENRGNIVFIRKKDNPKKSYITCEIRDGEICQYLFSYNHASSDSGEKEDDFRKKYQEYLLTLEW